MTGEEAKAIMRGAVGLMVVVNNTSGNPDPNLRQFVCKLSEAIELACTAIDMNEDRLTIDNGGKEE